MTGTTVLNNGGSGRGRTAPQLALHTCTTETLFRRCRAQDAAAREALVYRFLPLARKLARRYSHSSLADEDLVQVASMALLKAIDRFDPDRGPAFPAFATPTILGELRRHFRDTSWAVHVARAGQERALSVQNAIERLSALHGRPPTVQEMAVYLELSEEDVLDGLQANQAYAAMSLDAPSPAGGEDDELTLGSELGSADSGYEDVENGLAVADAVGALPEQDQRLLHMRFIAGMTQSEIGDQLGVSQMQVSRLLRRTLDVLRTRLDGLFDC
jgi:RNA polymerase sigma-B factor